MARRYDTVSLLTDYGTADEFAGVLRAVIRDIAPHAATVDLTHQIPPFDVRAGSLALARCVSYLPSGVVVAVVDPGVGTARQAIAVEVAAGEGVFVGPDNGLLAPAVAMAGGAERAVLLTEPAYQLPAAGATFAGRDVFAPVAAHLCNGVALTEFGELIDPDTLTPGLVPLPRDDGDTIVGEVLWVDHFGNCQLNIGPAEVEGFGAQVMITVGETSRVAAVASSFAELAGGAVGLVIDSYGMLAVCLDRRSAAAELGIGAGDAATIARLERPAGVTSPVTMRTR